jgi:hypothetical protein
MKHRIAIACEARADAAIATRLIERVLQNKVAWMADAQMQDHLEFRGLDDSDTYLRWASILRTAKQHGMYLPGHFRGLAGIHEDARSARLAIMLFQHFLEPLSAIVLLRDLDNEPKRGEAIRSVRDGLCGKPQIIVGLPNPKRECWVLAGFKPQDETEEHLLNELKTGKDALSFDPITHAHCLTATGDTAKNSAKRVLEHLTRKDRDREAECWETAPLDDLKENGKKSGLSEYLDEICTRLARHFGGTPRT